MGYGHGHGLGLGVKNNWRSYWTTRYINGLLAVPYSSSRIDLSWVNNGTQDWTGTKVYVSTDNAVTFSLLTTITSIGTTYSATGLTAGQFYVFYIAPYKSNNIGSASNRAYNYTLEAETTTYITGLTTPLTDAQKGNINHFFGDIKAWLGITNISDKADISYVLCGATSESSLRNIVYLLIQPPNRVRRHLQQMKAGEYQIHQII